jgi:hypothetical protein
MDWYDLLRFSLLLSGAAGLLHSNSEMQQALRNHGHDEEARGAIKSGWFMFKLTFASVVVAGLLGELNKYMGYPFS